MSDAFYIEQTVFPSNLVKFFFNNFQVRICKNNRKRYNKRPLANYRYRRLINTAAWQDLTEPTDSMDPFLDDDDDDIEQLFRATSSKNKAVRGDADVEMEDSSSENSHIGNKECISPINIYIRNTSMSIDNKENHLFHSTVLSAAVLPGNEKSKGEDTLLVTLSSGHLLVIRILITEGQFIPIVVQKFNLSFDDNLNKILSLGHNIFAFKLGNLIAISAFSKVIRLAKVEYDENGVPSVGESMNSLTNGLILQSCFLEPLDSNHIMLLNLISTDENILQLEFSEFYMNEEFENTVRKSTLLLPNSFELPSFLIPLKETQCVLMVQDTKCIIKGISYLMSHDGLDQAEIDLPSKKSDNESFHANSYYIPKSMISCLPCPEYENTDIRFDQVLLSNSHPSMWLLEVFFNTKKLEWFIKLRKLFTQATSFSHFSLEYISGLNYDLTCMNERGIVDMKTIKLTPREGDKSCFVMKVMEDRGSIANWFPTFDYTLVDPLPSKFVNKTTSEELWCVSRCNKRASLLSLKKGYSAEKSKAIEEFKNAERIFKFEKDDGKTCFLLSFLYKSVLVTFSEDKSVTSLVDDDGDTEREEEIPNDDIETIQELTVDQRTLCFSKLQDGRFVQVLENGWRIGKIDNLDTLSRVSVPFVITLACSHDDFVAIAYDYINEDSLLTNIEIFKIGEGTELKPLKIEPMIAMLQPSFLKLMKINGQLYLIVGAYTNFVYFFAFNDEDGFYLARSLNINNIKKGAKFEIPHDLILVDSSKLILSSKNGYILIMCYNEKVFRDVILLRVGETSVDFLELGNKKYYLLSKAIWKLDLNQSYHPERVYVSETTDRSCTSAVLLPTPFDETTGEADDDQLLAIRDDGLCSLFVSQYINSNIKKVSLGLTPMRLMYYKSHGIFVSIVNAENDDDDKLRFVDHKTKKALKISQDQNIISNCEYPLSLSEWQVKSKRHEDYVHSHLLVGCGTSSGGGSIKIIELKKSKDTISLKQLNAWTETSPVQSINQLQDSTVIYASGNSLYLKRYLPSESKMSSSNKSFQFFSNVKGIKVLGPDTVIVVTATESYYMFKYDGSCLSHVLNDPTNRFLMGNTVVHGTSKDDLKLVVADSQHCSISCIDLGSSPNEFSGLSKTLAKVKVPFIPRLQSCKLEPIWLQDSPRLRQKFMCVGLNGEIKVFTSITEEEYQKLERALQRQWEKSKDRGLLKLSDLSTKEFPLKGDSRSNILNVDSLATSIMEIDNIEIDMLLHLWLL